MSATQVQRVIASVCVIVALLAAIAPRRGLTVCLEPDGAVSVDVAATSASCGCSTRESACESARERGAPRARSGERDACRACEGVLVPSSVPEMRERSRAIEVPPAGWCDTGFVVARQGVLAPRAALDTRAHAQPPRPPPALANIRTIVLSI